MKIASNEMTKTASRKCLHAPVVFGVLLAGYSFHAPLCAMTDGTIFFHGAIIEAVPGAFDASIESTQPSQRGHRVEQNLAQISNSLHIDVLDYYMEYAPDDAMLVTVSLD